MPSSSSHPLGALRLAHPHALEPERDVLGDGAPRVEAVGLEHHARGRGRARRPARRRSSTVPEVGTSRPATMFSSVDLPQPDDPTRHTNSGRRPRGSRGRWRARAGACVSELLHQVGRPRASAARTAAVDRRRRGRAPSRPGPRRHPVAQPARAARSLTIPITANTMRTAKNWSQSLPRRSTRRSGSRGRRCAASSSATTSISHAAARLTRATSMMPGKRVRQDDARRARACGPAPSVYAVRIISRGTSRATSAIIRMLKNTVPTTIERDLRAPRRCPARAGTAA